MTSISPEALDHLDDFTLCDAACEMNGWNWHPALPWLKPGWWSAGFDERKKPIIRKVYREAERRCGRKGVLFHHNVVRRGAMTAADFEVWWRHDCQWPDGYIQERTSPNRREVFFEN